MPINSSSSGRLKLAKIPAGNQSLINGNFNHIQPRLFLAQGDTLIMFLIWAMMGMYVMFRCLTALVQSDFKKN